MSLNPVIARAQAGARRLADTAVWTHGETATALRGLFVARQATPLDGRARPLQPTFTCFAADAPGLAVGDTLTLAGATWDITGLYPDGLGETELELRPHR